MPRRPGDSARDTRGRIPNKVIWGLEDLIAIMSDDIPPLLWEMLEWIENEEIKADEKFDHRRKASLGQLSKMVAKLQLDLSKVERKVRDARNGEYRENNNESLK